MEALQSEIGDSMFWVLLGLLLLLAVVAVVWLARPPYMRDYREDDRLSD